MTENLIKFLTKVSEDKELSEKLGKEADREKIIAVASEMGIELTAEDFEKQAYELSDDELDSVAGGTSVNCSCALGGGGAKDENDKACACVAAGFGYEKNGEQRCFCAIAGFGYDY